MMKRFVILVLRRQGEEVEAVKELYCTEERAVRTSINIFKCGVQKVVVVDEHINVVFTDRRICKCSNIQQELAWDFFSEPCFRDVCMDCRQVIDWDRVLKVEEYEGGGK